jgi:NAD(P)-dependent dehydrogenase (short-subunit alcohol dehydrogenase family)
LQAWAKPVKTTSAHHALVFGRGSPAAVLGPDRTSVGGHVREAEDQEVAPLGIRVTLAEPGAMRTDWAGSSMDIPAFGPGYEATVGAIARHLRETSGTEPIDPAKVARAFLDLADNPQPPLHLVLGRAAVDHMASVMRETAAEDERWAQVGRSVDFD